MKSLFFPLAVLLALVACSSPTESPSAAKAPGSGGGGNGGPPPAADQAPLFVVQPDDVSVQAPASAVFQANASGFPSPTFQWQRSTDGGTTWTSLGGATGASLVVTPTAVVDSGTWYRLQAVNRAGSATSRVATLTVTASIVGPHWSDPVRIGPLAPVSTFKARLGLDAAGNGLAVWEQMGTGSSELWWSRYTPSTGWSEAAALVVAPPGSAQWPQLRMRSDGTAVLAWQWLDPNSRGQVWIMPFSPPTGWGTGVRLDTWDPDELQPGASEPHLGVGDDGSWVVVWSQSIDFVKRILVVRQTAGGAPSSPEELATGLGTGAGDPVLNDQGEGWIPWYQYTPEGTSLNLTKVGGQTSTVWTKVANVVNLPVMAVNHAGQAIVAWSEQVGGRFDHWASRYTPGSGWGTAGWIEDDTTSNEAFYPQLQVLLSSEGKATALWGQTGTAGSWIYQNTQEPGQPWGTPAGRVYGTAQISAALTPSGSVGFLFVNGNHVTVGVDWAHQSVVHTGTSSLADLAFDGQGRGWATWLLTDATGRRLYGTRYE